MYGNNTETLYTKGLPGFVQQEARDGSLKPGDVTDMNPSWVWAAGAGISTAEDLATWAGKLADGNLLNARLQHARLASTEAPEAGSVDGGRYGLALAKFGRFYGHAGIVPGFSTFAGYDPANHVTLVVWTNLAPAPDGRSPATAIARAVAAKVYADAAGMEPVQ
jgi:D-alanyl-D-alanine carboxypeptidase